MISLPKPVRVATLNVRGLADRRRQRQLYRLVTEQDLDVVALQETKVENEDQTERMVRQFTARYDVCVSHAVGLSAGCILLVRQSIGAMVESVTSSPTGRLIVCDITFASREWRIICIYAHTSAEERKHLFEGIRSLFDTERMIIFLGDFNCVCSTRDKSSATPFRDGSTMVLNDIINEYGLEDVGDILAGTPNVQFTHFQGSSHARLDRCYVSLELVPLCGQYHVLPVSFSDHCLVSFTLAGNKQRRVFSWDLWKLNSKLMGDNVFTDGVKECLGRFFDGDGNDLGGSWELFKQEVKMKALERTSAINNNERKRETLLRRNLAMLIEEESRSPGVFKSDISTVKAQLEVLDKERYHGALVRARARKLFLGEAPSKRALSAEKRYANRNEIAEIEY